MKVFLYTLNLCGIIGLMYALCVRNKIQRDGNAYKGLIAVISNKLEPSEIEIEKLKDFFTAASALLYNATIYHLYLKDITIVIPSSWPSNIDGYISGPQLDSAHVIFDQPNPLYNKPYVSGMTGCGKPGKQIHLVPNTVQNLPAEGVADKQFVHLWGHYRWGLFDEHGDREYPVLESNSNIWFHSSEGTYKPNICVKDIIGKSELNYCGSDVKCSVDKNGLPEKNCTFCVDKTENTVKGSLMGKTEISSVKEFCDDENSTVPHNKEAETPQNKICQGKSAWEIMRLHSDFKDTIPGTSSQDTTPRVRIVKQKTDQTVVLVLDRSGSMDGAKIKALKEVSSMFINDWLINGSSVGLVTFSSYTRIIASLKRVTSDVVRKKLVASINGIYAYGKTSICAGLRRGIQVLKSTGDNIIGNHIILVSDGKNTHKPDTEDVLKEILEENIIVTTIAIGNEADKDMETLARESGGLSHFYSGKTTSTALIDSYLHFAECGSDDDNKLYQIESKSLIVKKGQNYSTNVYVDSTLGKDTVFLLQGPSVKYVTATLVGPGKEIWTFDSCTYTCRIDINGLTEAGNYILNISSSVKVDITLTLVVNSHPRDPSEDVFTATAWSSSDSYNFSSFTPIELYASVKKGPSPVLDAYVSMEIEDAEGRIKTVDLSDNGQYEDLIKGDGLYTGELLPSEIGIGGRHNMKLNVKGKSGETKIIVPNDEGDSTKTQTVGEFKRVESGGSFTVYDYTKVNNTKDTISPARITTLQIVRRKGHSIDVNWIAVGDDFSSGNASQYDILLSKSLSTLRISPDTVKPLTRDIPRPSIPGSLEAFSLQIPKANVNYYLAVRAVDEAGNKGNVSNILSLSVITDDKWDGNKEQSSSYNVLKTSIWVAGFVALVNSCGRVYYMYS